MDLQDALIDWDEPDDANGNTAHIADHDHYPAHNGLRCSRAEEVKR